MSRDKILFENRVVTSPAADELGAAFRDWSHGRRTSLAELRALIAVLSVDPKLQSMAEALNYTVMHEDDETRKKTLTEMAYAAALPKIKK
jgi:hypothetical protein